MMIRGPLPGTGGGGEQYGGGQGRGRRGPGGGLRGGDGAEEGWMYPPGPQVSCVVARGGTLGGRGVMSFQMVCEMLNVNSSYKY